MANLTKAWPTGKLGSATTVFNPFGSGGVAASTKLWGGAMIGFNASGFLARPGDAGVSKIVGISSRLVDNSAGTAGALTAEYEVGVFPMSMGAGADALTIANLLSPVFASDDNTVNATDGGGTRPFAGLFLGLDAFGHALVQFAPWTSGASDMVALTWQKTAADGAAATATTEFPLGIAAFASKVGNLKIANGAGTVTANDTNFATIILSKRTAGGAAVTVAQVSTQTTAQTIGSGSWVAWTPVIMPSAGNVAAIAQGDELTLQITKSGTGVVVPICTVEIDLLPS